MLPTFAKAHCLQLCTGVCEALFIWYRFIHLIMTLATSSWLKQTRKIHLALRWVALKEWPSCISKSATSTWDISISFLRLIFRLSLKRYYRESVCEDWGPQSMDCYLHLVIHHKRIQSTIASTVERPKIYIGTGWADFLQSLLCQRNQACSRQLNLTGLRDENVD